MKKMNILFTIWSFEYGGAERFVLNLIKALDKTIYNPIVFSDKNQKGPLENEFKKAGAKVIYSRFHRFKHPKKFTNQLKEIIKEEKIDIIHANDDLNMYFALKAKPESVKLIAHSHTTNFKFTNNAVLSKLLSQHIKKYIIKKADLRLSCGREAGGALFGNKDYQLIENGILLNDYYYSEKTRMGLRNELGIPADYVVMLNIGRVDKNKNHTFLVEVFTEYQKINKESKLVIIGNGYAMPELKESIEKNNLQSEVIVLNPRENAYEYYNLADVFVMPSLYEGMPMVSVEAQTNGLKCVFSSTISKEADHLGTAEFISLDKTPKEWAEKIFKLDLKRENNVCDKMDKYNIKMIATTMSKCYADLVYK